MYNALSNIRTLSSMCAYLSNKGLFENIKALQTRNNGTTVLTTKAPER